MNSKLSFTTMATPGLDIPAQVLVAKKYGFQGIDFRVGEPGMGEIPEDLYAERAKQIKEMLGGLELPGLLCYNKNIHAGKEEMTASLLWCIHIAKLLDCHMIRVFSGKIETEEQHELLVQVLKDVLKQDYSPVKLGLQVHKNNGISVRQGLTVCQALNHPRVGLILSPDQSYLAQEDWESLIPDVAKCTHQIYVADLDEHGDFCLIGQGIIDYAGILNELKQHGFEGYVTLKWEKCWIPQLPDHPEAFRAFMTYMDNSAQ